MTQADPRYLAARDALNGLSVGDAFGQTFFHTNDRAVWFRDRALAKPPWRWTDDTAMALSIVEILGASGEIDQDALADRFATIYREEPTRGYGGGAHDILAQIGSFTPWPQASSSAFGGTGSMGNGAAMRVAPLGAFFAPDLDQAVVQAEASAEVTHFHTEGKAGAVAVAVAAALACRARTEQIERGAAFIDRVAEHLPECHVREGLVEAARLAPDTPIATVAEKLGNGSRVLAQDTVPLVIWVAAHHLDTYEEALWLTVSAEGDMDTTAAMVGGIVASKVGTEAIPAAWLEAREALPPTPLDEGF